MKVELAQLAGRDNDTAYRWVWCSWQGWPVVSVGSQRRWISRKRCKRTAY